MYPEPSTTKLYSVPAASLREAAREVRRLDYSRSDPVLKGFYKTRVIEDLKAIIAKIEQLP